jgi:quercetin dioxygenase-like cupin family protein
MSVPVVVLRSRSLFIVACCCTIAGFVIAQQSAQRAGRVEIDNQQVHVVRNMHAPHEKTPMHSHPNAVVVYLTDVHERSTYPNGTSKEINHRAGDVVWSPARSHVLENLSDQPIEVIEIEIKDSNRQ